MNQEREAAIRFAACVDDSEYPASLDYLYPADYFVMVELPQEVTESLLRAA